MLSGMFWHKIKNLTGTPDLSKIDDDYFYRMLSPQALKISAPYHLEEEKNLVAMLQQCHNISDMNFIAVGGGELWCLRIAMQYAKRYVCIEPLANVFLNDSVKYMIEQQHNIEYIANDFEATSRSELPEGGCFFMFLFNIFAYINNPLEAISRMARPGDVIFITTWADTPEAQGIRKAYFDYLNSFEDTSVIDPSKMVGLSRLEQVPFNTLHFYKKHEYVEGRITKTLIVYT